MTPAGPILRTVLHLRPSQIAHRLWRQARAPWFASSHYRPPRPSEAPRAVVPSLWPGDAENGRRILDGGIRLVGLERRFAPPYDWEAAGMPLLWRFSLHYFDWLDDLAAIGTAAALKTARDAVSDWIERHPSVAGPAWHPYPLSLRLHAWLRHAAWLLDGADGPFVQAFAATLDRQARHLPGVVEHDVAGNHVVKNLKALIAAGAAIPGHADSGRRAVVLLEREVARQVLPDGCHYERSPSYHLQVLCDLIDVRHLLAAAAPAWLDDAIDRMGRALAFFRLGDGLLPLFNDGEVGEARIIEAVAERLGGLPEPPAILPDAGYARLARGGTIVIFDAGLCCPDDLPAHAHADTLSFEMSSDAQRMVVNCGTYAYQDPVWRNRLRGTPAHSTADIDGLDSAEVYGAFRVGRRPRDVALRMETSEPRTTAEGRHDGYRRLGIVATRRLELSGEGLAGNDAFASSGARPHRAHLHFQIHPSVAAHVLDDRTVQLAVGGRTWRLTSEAGPIGVRDGIYAPRFHQSVPLHDLVIEVPVTGLLTTAAWRLGCP